VGYCSSFGSCFGKLVIFERIIASPDFVSFIMEWLPGLIYKSFSKTEKLLSKLQFAFYRVF